ncbi:MAG: hypothetical protein LPK85_10790 [Gammaproteobacteria bacterium]|nr:hypothetical protein [Gammaproteobacteria bacterium]
MFVCTECKRGLMDPLRNEDEPEYTDQYKCGHCGHTATIPSLVIILSQILTGIMGGGVTVYLFILHLGRLLSALQLTDESPGFALDGLLVLIASGMLAGFAYTLYRAGKNLYLRRRYLRPIL